MPIVNALFLDSSGGGGHLLASLAMSQRMQEEQTGRKVHHINVLDDTLGRVGKRFAETWNNAQKEGNVNKQVRLIKYQPWAEAFFSPFIFCHVLYAVLKYDVHEIVDTQGLWTVSTVRAVRFANLVNKLRKKNRKIHVQKIFIECPFGNKNYCFDSVRKLNKRDRKVFTLYSIPTNYRTHEEECAYWKKACKLSLEKKEVVYIEPPIRSIFLKYKNTAPATPNELRFKFNSPEEKQILQSLYNNLTFTEKKEDNKELFEVSLKPDDAVMTLMLGSQAAEKSTLHYISESIELARSPEMQNQNLYFFVFCNKHIPGTNSLFKKVVTAIKSENSKFPPNLKIIPLTFQDAEEIAPMIYRSKIAITRTGAQATQETMSVANQHIFIHSEMKKVSADMTEEQLLKGIPLWEKNNALFLKERKNAEITTPLHFKEMALKVFSAPAKHEGLKPVQFLKV